MIAVAKGGLVVLDKEEKCGRRKTGEVWWGWA